MKTKINCRNQSELAMYLEELITYFRRFERIPIEENDWIPVPGESVLRIRYDQVRDGGSIKIVLDWNT